MSGLPIINARRELSWQRRLASDVVTVALWIGWGLLWLPVIRKLRAAIFLHANFGLAAREVLDTVAPISLSRAALLLLVTTGSLLLWSLLPSRRAVQPPATETLEDEARRLLVPIEELRKGRASRIAVVHHDEAGQVIGIESRGLPAIDN